MFALVGQAISWGVGRIGQGDSVSAIVRFARFLYSVTLGTIALAWYTGWRNKRVAPGDKKFPVPGVNQDPEAFPVSRDDPDVSGYDTQPMFSGSGSAGDTTLTDIGGNASAALALTGMGAFKPGRIPGGVGSEPITLLQAARIAQKMGLRVSEMPGFGGVTPGVHATNSLHYQGRAFDASAPMDPKGLALMNNFAAYMVGHHGRRITELIHNPNASIKNGQVVPPSFWGAATWSGHKNHVHLGI